MAIKRTISFAEDTLESLEQLVPKYKRSSFVNSAVVDALRQRAKEKAIENFPRVKGDGKPVVEILQDIRQQESDKFIDKQ
jgi:hypothetical protein